MKRLIVNIASALSCLLAALTLAHAAPLRDCRVTQVVSDVKLLPEKAAPRPASINDSVHYGTAVRTGTQSRSELTFVDQTMTRLGANTIFSLKGEATPPAEGPIDLAVGAPSHLKRAPTVGSRVMNLVEGAMLFQVPKDAGGATIKTVPITAAITGTTGIGECHASSADHPNPISKWFCLEGHMILELNDGSGQTVELSAGQMIVTDGTSLPEPMYFNIAALTRTSPFFDPPPPSWDLIQAEIERQTAEQVAGVFLQTDAYAALDSSKIASRIDQGMAAQRRTSAGETPTPTPTTPTPTPMTPTPTPMTPTPTPGKFGTLATITSPDPFVIDSNTVLNTDPTITKALTTSFGKIYRTSANDGSRTQWMFGATSAFDNSSGFDHGAGAHFLDNIAGFKFQSLILDSDPTIQTTGGVTRLGLIGVDGITTNGTGATFTFSGIDTLLLATQDGSIDLQSGDTFNGPGRMYVYARGSGSHLTVDSDISTAIDLNLFSEGTVSIAGTLHTANFSSTSGGDFTNTSGHVTANGMTVASQTGDITVSSDAFHAGRSGISLSLAAGNAVNITMGSDLSMFQSASSISVSGEAINLIAADVVTLNLNVTSPATFTAGADGIVAPNVDFLTAGSLELQSDGDIDIYGAQIPIANRTISGSINAGGSFHAVADVITGELVAGGGITVDEGSVLVANVTAGETIEVGGDITASEAVAAGGDLIANNVAVGTTLDVGGDLVASRVSAGGNVNAYGVAVPTVSAPHSVLTVGDDGIFPYVDPNVGADLQHTITADSIVSSGGIFFISALYGGINGLAHGGLLTINARTILFDDGTNGIGFTDLDGANFGAFGGAVSEAGDGGTLIVRTTGDITATADAVIIARTGLTPPDAPFGGVGGTVILDSSNGSVSIDGLIRVSQATSFESHGDPQRRSASGGNIMIHSGLTSGQAISILENASLEALFHDDAPGIAGSITAVSEGGDITIKGNLEAERGTILISNGGTGVVAPHRPSGGELPLISLNGATFTTGTLNISSIGDLEVGLQSAVNLDGVNLSLHADNDINMGTVIGLGTARETTGDVTFTAGGNLSFDNIDVQRTNGGISSGLNFSVDAQGNITGSATFRLLVDHVGSFLSDGANISVDAGQTLGVRALNLEVNNTGGQIGTGGTVSVSATNLVASSVEAKVNNQNGGLIGSGGTIDFNVSGGANIAHDANLQVLGSNGVGGAAINVNGGNYQVGGTFRAFTDGNGTIGLNNASIHADVLKVGALGANGVLNIGGGTLSADTTLKLYASGSSGQLNFISDVTLNGNSTKILAANSVTIMDDVTVTIGGTNAADVFTNNANYSEQWGGNDSTTGTFAGAGANSPLPLPSAPPFDESAQAGASHVPGNTNGNPSGSNGALIRVNNSGQLLSLLDGGAVGPGGKLIVPNSGGRNNPINSNPRNPAARSIEAREARDLTNKSRTKTLLP